MAELVTRTMRDTSQLPYLIRLLEDDSAMVQSAVLKELRAYGPELESTIEDAVGALDDHRRQLVARTLSELRREQLRARWPEVFRLEGDKSRLEHGLGLLAGFQSGYHRMALLSAGLDALAAEFHAACDSVDVVQLAAYLFRARALRGARTSYYDPRSSNLLHVLEHGEGIPISLCCIYILVAHREGLHVEGCNFPGHFMAFAWHRGRRQLVDCFNGGRFMREDQLVISTGNGMKVHPEVNDMQADAAAILRRVLRNLANAYERAAQPADRDAMLALADSGPKGTEQGEP